MSTDSGIGFDAFPTIRARAAMRRLARNDVRSTVATFERPWINGFRAVRTRVSILGLARRSVPQRRYGHLVRREGAKFGGDIALQVGQNLAPGRIDAEPLRRATEGSRLQMPQ